MATQAERRTATRGKILAVAAELLAAKGYDSLTVDEIVLRANVAKGTFYQHFKSKEELVLALLRQDLAGVDQQIEAALASGAPPLSVLRYIVEGSAGWLERNPHLVRAAALQSMRQAPSGWPAGHPSSRRFMALALGAAQRDGLVRSDLPAEELAQMLGALYLPAIDAWLADPTGPSLTARLTKYLQLFLEGAAKGGARHE